MSTGITRAAAELAVSLGPDDISPAASRLVSSAFLDAIGCAVAGADTDDARIVRAWVRSAGSAHESTFLGCGGGASASLAALANGVAVHAQELDDASVLGMHPSACLVPPLLAVGERERSSGDALGAAYAVGFEIFARLCRAMNPAHYARGYHPTSTVGAVAAAAATGRLLGLDASRVATAMAIAGSAAGGLRKNIGSMVKPLHAGRAACEGVAAAELARAGLTGDPAILDDEDGFVAVLSGDPSAVERAREAMSRSDLELDLSGIIFKQYACCGALHAALDATLALRAAHGIDPGGVAGVTCRVNATAAGLLVHHAPGTPAEGRFSIEHSVAVALVDGAAGVGQYTVERMVDPRLHDLSRRVAVVVDESLPSAFGDFPAVVEVVLASGETLVQRVDAARGAPGGGDLSAADLERKFDACVAGRLASADCGRVKAACADVFALADAGELVRAAAGV